MTRKWIIVTLILAALVIVPYVAAGWNEKPVDESFRRQAPGQFLPLSDGQIHYRWLGNEADEVIVLLHGVSVPQYVFAQMADALVESGFRVLLFDHFGHGYSDRPRASYDPDFYAQQMLELFDGLELVDPVHVGALSMGGAIASDFTARHPGRVKSLTLFAPAGIRLVNEKDSALVSLLKAPVVGNWLWRIMARDFYFPDIDADSADDEPDSGEVMQGIPEQQADYEGYLMAMRQIFRNFPLSHRDELLVTINKSSIPVLGIFGGADKSISLQSVDVLARLIPRARIEILDGATHHLNIHRWRETSEIMVSFIRNNE